MKKVLLAGLFAMSSVAPAFAGDVQAHCEAYQAEHGGEADCSCIAEKAAGDDALTAEILAISTPADLESAGEDATALAQSCTS